MKKIGIGLIVLALVGATVWAAGVATYNHRVHVHDIGTVTVDAQQSGTWDSITTHIDTAHAGLLVDSTEYVLTMEGIAHMNPGATLYLGCTRADSGDVGRDREIDSIYFTASAALRGPIDLPFTWRAYCAADSAHIDTFFFNAACGGSTTFDQVTIRDLRVTVGQLTQDR